MMDCVQSPLIVIGPGRSGTTLLTRLLNSQPGMQFFGETDFLTYRLWREVAENAFWFNWRRLTELNPGDGHEPLPALSEAEVASYRAHCGAVVASAVWRLLGGKEGLAWGFKEIWNGAPAHTVPWEPYDHVFPNARWLLLLRHPLDFAASSAAWMRRPLDEPYLEQCCRDWVAIVRKSRERQKTGRYMEFKFENVVCDPHDALAKVLRFAGLTPDQIVLDEMRRSVLKSRRDASTETPLIGLEGPLQSIEGFKELCQEFDYETTRMISVPEIIPPTGPIRRDLREFTAKPVRESTAAGPRAGLPVEHLVARKLGHLAREHGHAWQANITEFAAFSDTPELPRRSKLILLEDDRQLGPAHSAHDDIRAFGGGRYSHWGSTLYFSTSDNTDPNTNGRSYLAILAEGR